ncbi:uncharacterized protein LOC130911949 [Corythoichthys intestinalis]|uniref:uncharacterized protein LOC130911949 n=1 Tax=Corythoichthys intestinalis TaxID=161448 RepID=UPI0025A64C46|nr:uncharacterized protein LOC130911949 [Corythoichthys intestinalis]
MRTARFSSLKVLARWENYKSENYKLTQTVLARSLIEKQSVGLIVAVVNLTLCSDHGQGGTQGHGRHLGDVTEDKGELEMGRAVLKRPSLLMAHLVSFGISLWDSLMCRKHKKEHRVRFLCLAMHHSDGFRHLLEFLVATDPTLQWYKCQEGHRLANTILPHIRRSLFNCFGANFFKDVTSEARKNKALVSPSSRKRSRVEEGRKERARNRNLFKSRKLTRKRKA